MTKKIIIILIILILLSLGVIGYIVISQNPNFNLNLRRFWSFGQTASNQETPKVPANFFPQATNTDTVNTFTNSSSSLQNNNQNNQTADQINGQTIDSPILTGVKALGLVAFNNNGGERILFVDRDTGNLEEIDAQNNLIKLTNTTILNIGQAYWGQNKGGERVILRQTVDGKIINSNNLIKNTELATQKLSSDIKTIAISPDRLKFFTLETNSTGVNGYLNDWTGNKKKVWSFPFSDWQIAWPKADLIALQTKASVNDSGYLYFLNPNTGSFSKILDNINGLTTSISPNGQKIIFSRSNLGQFSLYVYDLPTKKTDSLGIKTLPEKCSWLDTNILYCAVPRTVPTGRYPDDWYQGQVTFTDDIWKIDLKQKTVQLVISVKSPVDLTNLTLAPKRGSLYTINKSDNSIQVFSLP